MFEIMPETTHDLLAIQVTGTLQKQDYEDFIRWIEARLEEHGHPSILIYMKDFEGWDDFLAFAQDVRVGVTLQEEITRIAVVGDRTWERWMTLLAKPFMSAETRFFDEANLDAALAWARVPHIAKPDLS